MRAAFTAYASTHEPASIRRCWPTWNMLCDFLYTAGLIPANPMPVRRTPQGCRGLAPFQGCRGLAPFPPPARGRALLETVEGDHESQRRTDWAERDLPLILTGLLAGLRPDELRRANVVGLHISSDGGAVIHVCAKAARTPPCQSRPIC
jgi:integrase/recombinase XerC